MKLLSFFTSASWTTYALVALLVALLALGFLYKKELEHVGSLEAEKVSLTRDLEQAELDKEHLNATIANTAQKSLEDSVEREKLKEQVTQLNGQVAKLKNLTKPRAQNNAISTSQASDDIELSDDLQRLLNESACSANTKLCRNTSQSSK